MKVSRALKVVSTFYGILTLGGATTAGFGIWTQINRKAAGLLKVVDDSTITAILTLGTPMLIALGCVLTLMGVVGCLGALKRKSWMVLVFFIIVLIIFILQVIASVFLLLPNSVKEKSLSSIEAKFIESLQTTYEPKEMNIWDEAMNKMKCCGYKGYGDFTNSKYVNETRSYPRQCCGKDSKTDIQCGEKDAKTEGVRGCIDVLMDENIPVSGPLSFLLGIVEIVALIISLKVYRCLKRLPDLPDPFDNL